MFYGISFLFLVEGGSCGSFDRRERDYWVKWKSTFVPGTQCVLSVDCDVSLKYL